MRPALLSSVKHPARRRQHGLTLLELVVALALSALVSLLGAAALGAGSDFYARSTQRLHQHEQLRAALRTLRFEWQARARLGRSDATSLEFATLHTLSDPVVPGVAWARYACEGSPETGFTLTHQIKLGVPEQQGDRLQAAPSAASADLPEPETLLYDLRECAFSVLRQVTEKTGETLPLWKDEWDSQEPAPRLIRIKLAGPRGDLPPVVFVAGRER